MLKQQNSTDSVKLNVYLKISLERAVLSNLQTVYPAGVAVVLL